MRARESGLGPAYGARPTPPIVGRTRHRSAADPYPPISGQAASRFLAALILSAGTWLAVMLLGSSGFSLGFAVALALPCAAAIAALGGRPGVALQAFAYIAAIEPAVRTYVRGYPYLGLTYSALLLAIVIAIRVKGPFRATAPFIAYLGYILVELVGLAWTDSPVEARGVLASSIALLTVLALTGKIRLGRADSHRVIGAYLLGIMTLACLTLPPLLTGGVAWAAHSNFGATAGMGPNQLSLLYAGAIFLCLTLARDGATSVRILLWGAAAVMLVLMVLTFSRGGLYILIGGLALNLLASPKRGLATVGFLAGYAIAAGIGLFVSVELTEGRVLTRFSDTDTSNRDELARIGWQMFREQPLTGVGTGNYFAIAESPEYFGKRVGAHNELTRAAAEHGIPGLSFWLLFVVASLYKAVHRLRGVPRAFRLSLLAITFVTMLYNGLKLLAQPFLVFVALTAFSDVPPSAASPESHL